MGKVVKILFGISDFCAWSLIMFALICVIAFPFIGPMYGFTPDFTDTYEKADEAD